MRARLIRFAKLASYPLFYLACLVIFGYLCFPFDRLKTRIVAEFDRMQQAERQRSPGKAAMKLELGELDSYWLSGVEVRQARLIIPPDTSPKRSSKLQLGGKDDGPPKPSIIEVDRAHARVRLLPLLVGSVRIDFGMTAFGGEVYGTVPYGAESGVEVTIEDLQLGEMQPLQALTGLPVLGKLSGELSLTPKDGKFAKANGKLALKIERIVIGDGKATLQGVALPAARVGDLSISADAKDGAIKIDEISAAGPDFELSGDGRIRIRERWNRSRADINLKFRFTDSYRDKDDTTRSLLGKPGSKMPAALEFDPNVKRAKTPDGFYGWHVHGTLDNLKFDPQGTKAPGRSRTTPRKPGQTTRSKPTISNRFKNRDRRGRPSRTTPSPAQPATPSPGPADDRPPADDPPSPTAPPKEEPEEPSGDEEAAAEEAGEEEASNGAEDG
ncbi:MAG: type II secretion system protein GspN [Deltaproteobacteria bacterium]|jgi:type II secretion system protein N|nr:type II secretion system protein GspN [Deltaproteobacteria bacterium]MBW2534110.1 type II secretion system protein GspN [Deltaproteobacteria bacterium]